VFTDFFKPHYLAPYFSTTYLCCFKPLPDFFSRETAPPHQYHLFRRPSLFYVFERAFPPLILWLKSSLIAEGRRQDPKHSPTPAQRPAISFISFFRHVETLLPYQFRFILYHPMQLDGYTRPFFRLCEGSRLGSPFYLSSHPICFGDGFEIFPPLSPKRIPFCLFSLFFSNSMTAR